MKYIDAEKLKEECKKVTEKILLELGQYPYMRMIVLQYYEYIDKSIDTLQQEEPRSRPESSDNWKPNEEQMKALNEIINTLATSKHPHESDYLFNMLNGLRNGLKKL